MKNLEQLRAQHALDFWANTRNPEVRADDAAERVRGLACLVLRHGLLAAIAFAKDQSSVGQRSGLEELMLETGRFLASRERGLLPFPVQNTDELIRGLTNHPSSLLQQATAEAIAYLGYLKRFAPKSGGALPA